MKTRPPRSKSGRSRNRMLFAAVAVIAIAFTPVVAPAGAAQAPEPLPEVVATTASPGYAETGTWTAARDPGYNGGVSRYSREPGATATWTLVAPSTGSFKIGIYYAASQDNAKAEYLWTGGETVVVNQATGGNSWRTIGGVNLVEGETITITVTATTGLAPSAPGTLNVITRTDAVKLSQGMACDVVAGTPDPVPASTTDFAGYQLHQDGTAVDVSTDAWSMSIDRAGFRYSLTSGDTLAAAAHPDAGLVMGLDGDDACNAVSASLTEATDEQVTFSVLFSNGRTATVAVVPDAVSLNLRVTADDGRVGPIRVQTAGGLNPAYGLGDLGGWRNNLNAYGVKNLDYYAANSSGTTDQRFVSNFTVFPDRRLAQVALDRGRLAVEVDASATMLGVNGSSMPEMHYFFGDMQTIYQRYAEVRNNAGFIDAEPGYEFFGVGYESYGALAYDTNQETIEGSVAKYLEQGYPISWAVTGSGFWPYGDGSAQGTTSSFGMWGSKYPDPDGYKQFFADRDIDLILGLRQSFKALPADGGLYDPALDGPYTQEGLDNDYFLTDADGNPRSFSTISFPSGKVYLIDPDNPDAVAWFVENSRKWGVPGYKEDHMFNATTNGLYDNALVNAVDEALAADGNLMMVRNSAFSVPGSILRINDTDYNQGANDRDRTVVNGLAYAASGQPNFYPDIVGGRIMTDLETNVAKQKFLTRNAMMAAMSPSMSFGNEPWRMGTEELREATVKAAQWHDEYQPYIYSAAVDSWRTGYPSTATPLPIAFPDDAATHNLVSYAAKQYEWMMGPSLLVTPLYGSDTESAMSRDVYLPAGEWMDFESGERFTGPTTLTGYAQPFGKIPAFVGGTGILVHSADDDVAAQVFPVAAPGAALEYTAADGETTSTITAENTLWGADEIVVTESGSGGDVPFTVDPTTGAVEFAVAAGVDYVVSNHGPSIAEHPESVTITEGDDAVFSVTATGYPEAVYQWQAKVAAGSFADIDGATDSELQLSDVLLSGDGTQYRVRVSNAGDAESAVFSDAATLTVIPIPDTTAPTVELSVSNAGSGGWFGDGAVATLTATDDNSGVALIEYDLDNGGWTEYHGGVDLPEGQYTLKFRATDNEENMSAVQSRSVKVDGTAPVVWGWLDADGRLTTVATDAGSGVDRVEYSLDEAAWSESLEDLGTALAAAQVRGVDSAGNVSTPLELTRSDAAPTLTVSPGDVLTIERNGFAPGEGVRIELHSGPVVLGSVTASTGGVVSLTAAVPASVSAGAHSLVFITASGSGTVPIEIAHTGTDAGPWLLAALLLLLAGAATLLVTRARRKTAGS